jgi:hypothetical protein
MPRLLALPAVSALLLLIAVACGSENQASTGASENQESTAVAADQEPTPIDATPAVAPSDQEAYRQSIIGQGAVQETCNYMPEEAVADCTERGFYKLEPPPNDDVSCIVGLIGGDKPEFVLCASPAGDLKFFAIEP